MIIDRYILREIVKPTAATCTVLIFIYGCYVSARYLEEAVYGQLSGTTVILLILLRAAIAFEVLLPTTLYLSVVLALSRLYRDSEMIALFSCGIGLSRIVKSVFYVSVVISLIVASFSIYIRPWAWRHFFELKTQARSDFDLTRMKSGVFYELAEGEGAVFAETVDNQGNSADGVFVRTKRGDILQIIYAQHVEQVSDRRSDTRYVMFRGGSLYEVHRSDNEGHILDFEKMVMKLDNPKPDAREYGVKTIPTGELIKSRHPEEIAELEWRLNAPVAAILLALLGVPLSRSSPREGKFAKVPTAILVFAGYYYFIAIMKKWVGQGTLDAFPGVWWGHIVLVGLIIFFLARPVELFRHRKWS